MSPLLPILDSPLVALLLVAPLFVAITGLASGRPGTVLATTLTALPLLLALTGLLPLTVGGVTCAAALSLLLVPVAHAIAGRAAAGA